jgi:hypothetical protein
VGKLLPGEPLQDSTIMLNSKVNGLIPEPAKKSMPQGTQKNSQISNRGFEIWE